MTKPELTYLATKSVLTWHRAHLGLYPPRVASSAKMSRLAAGATAACEEPPTLRGVCIVHFLRSKLFAVQDRALDKIMVLYLLFLEAQRKSEIKFETPPPFGTYLLPAHGHSNTEQMSYRGPLQEALSDCEPEAALHLACPTCCCFAWLSHQTSRKGNTAVTFVFLSGAWCMPGHLSNRKSSMWPQVLLRCPNFRCEQPLPNGPAPWSGTEPNLGQATSSSILLCPKSAI